MLEEDSDRKEAFQQELEDVQVQITRLQLDNIIPEHFEEVKVTTEANALGVLASMLDLVGEPLSYLTAFGKLG